MDFKITADYGNYAHARGASRERDSVESTDQHTKLEPFYTILHSSLNVELIYVMLSSITQFTFMPNVNNR